MHKRPVLRWLNYRFLLTLLVILLLFLSGWIIIPSLLANRDRANQYGNAFVLPPQSATTTTHINAVAPESTSPSIDGCPIFPTSNIWNYDISKLPAYTNSADLVAGAGASGIMRPYFGAPVAGYDPPGIPFVVVPENQAKIPVQFTFASESDPGPYPIPDKPPIEGGTTSTGDRHILILTTGSCKLYELWTPYQQNDGSWNAGSGAVWNLRSNALRPDNWTSADAAGLPILPGLVRYDEVAAGAIKHALRVVINQTQNTFLWPARHEASNTSNPSLPPMGMRFRLRADFDISSFPPQSQVILTALKHFGMFIADNGGDTFNWDLCGTPDSRWDNHDLAWLNKVHGSDFVAVDESSLQINSDSGQAELKSVASTQSTISSTIVPEPLNNIQIYQGERIAPSKREDGPFSGLNAYNFSQKSAKIDYRMAYFGEQ